MLLEKHFSCALPYIWTMPTKTQRQVTARDALRYSVVFRFAWLHRICLPEHNLFCFLLTFHIWEREGKMYMLFCFSFHYYILPLPPAGKFDTKFSISFLRRNKNHLFYIIVWHFVLISTIWNYLHMLIILISKYADTNGVNYGSFRTMEFFLFWIKNYTN